MDIRESTGSGRVAGFHNRSLGVAAASLEIDLRASAPVRPLNRRTPYRANRVGLPLYPADGLSAVKRHNWKVHLILAEKQVRPHGETPVAKGRQSSHQLEGGARRGRKQFLGD